MNSIKNLKRLERLHGLILSECTGSPYELSRRLGISERLVYHLVEQLKDFDAKIGYDSSRRTYFYDDRFDLEFDVSVRVFGNNQCVDVFH